MKGATHNLIVRTRSDVAIYVLNNKRAHLRRLESASRSRSPSPPIRP
jgi:ribonuclease E